MPRKGERIDPRRGFRFVSDHQAVYPVRVMCRLPGLSPSGYYAWRSREPSDRARANAALTEEIVEIHAMSGGTYGAPRIHAELRARGREASVNRVARLMRAAEIERVSRRRKGGTTKRAAESRPAPDLVDRDFSASGLDELWVADITYVPTWAGFLYLAVVLDAWSRRIVGWSMATHLNRMSRPSGGHTWPMVAPALLRGPQRPEGRPATLPSFDPRTAPIPG